MCGLGGELVRCEGTRADLRGQGQTCGEGWFLTSIVPKSAIAKVGCRRRMTFLTILISLVSLVPPSRKSKKPTPVNSPLPLVALAWWPLHMATSKKMKMEMVNSLAAIGAIVDCNPITFLKSLLCCNLLNN